MAKNLQMRMRRLYRSDYNCQNNELHQARISKGHGIRINDSNAKNLYPIPEKLILSVLRESGTIEIMVDKE